MSIEDVREYCLSLPYVTEDMAFGEGHVLFRIFGKIFVCISLDRSEYVTVKCEPVYALDLRDRYEEIEPAWHWSKKYWNQICLCGNLSGEFIRSLVRHSYSEVVRTLTKKTIFQYPELLEIIE